MPLNVLSFSHDFSMDQVLDKYYDKQNAFDILIQNGADPSLKDNDGSSLIHSAAEGVEIYPLSSSCYHLALTLI